MATRAEKLKEFARGIQARIDAGARQLAEGGRVRMVGRKPKKPAAKIQTVGHHPKFGRIVRGPDGKTYAVKGGRVTQVRLRKPTLRERVRSKVEKLKAFAGQKVLGVQARLDARAKELARGGRVRAVRGAPLQVKQARPAASTPTKAKQDPTRGKTASGKQPPARRPASKLKAPKGRKSTQQENLRLSAHTRLQLLRQARDLQKQGKKVVGQHPTHGPMLIGKRGGVYVISKRTGAKIYI